MDAFRIVVVVALFVSYADLSNQLLEEDKEDVESIVETTTPSATTSATSAIENVTNEVSIATTDVGVRNCTTGKEDPGVCVKRASCHHGTSAIDFTLYAPKGHTSKCQSHEVCCPSSAKLLFELTKTWEDKFEFDDDD